MKQNDLMQPSVLQQNLFFQNIPEQDINQYQLKKNYHNLSSITRDDIKNNTKKQKHTKKISSFMNKNKNHSHKVKLSIRNDPLDHSISLNHEENLQMPEDKKILYKSNQKFEEKVQAQIHKRSLIQIIQFESEKSQNKEIQQKQQKRHQKTGNLERQESQNYIRRSTQQKFGSDVKFQKNRQINLCLSLEDSDSDADKQGQVSEYRLLEEEKPSPERKKKIKKMNYFSRKSDDQSQNTVYVQQRLSTQFRKEQGQYEQKIGLQGSLSKVQAEKSESKCNVLKIEEKNAWRQSGKKSLLLMNFDEQERAEQDNQSQSSQEIQNTIQTFQSIHNSHKPLQLTCQVKKSQILYTKCKKPNNNHKKILLNVFDDQSSSDSSEFVPNNNNPILLKTSYADSSHSISSDQERISLTRPINILEFSRVIPNLTYVYEPVPPNFIFQSIIKRYQEANQNNLVYEMFDQTTYKSILKVRNVSEGFQIFSSKQSIAVSWNGNSKNLPQFNQETSCALLSSNFFGTQFNCFRFNRNNQKPDKSKLNRLITINYDTNLFGLNGPRKMQAYIPGANYLVRGEKNLHQAYESEKELTPNQPSKIQYFINRKPKWNNQISSFVLNFNGRATVSSVKNFIITRPGGGKNDREGHDNLVLFGKIDKNVFNLDIKYPFNLVQGLALALSSFDKKIACE